jgi:hypothetical protein
MARWGRDLTIAAAALAAGYALFSPKAPTPASAPQYALASAQQGEPEQSRKKQIATAVTAAAIAAILVEESRNAYYATGRPCACPEDINRGGRRCGGTSAYSRPSGAQPYCYATDVPVAAIERHRQRLSAR